MNLPPAGPYDATTLPPLSPSRKPLNQYHILSDTWRTRQRPPRTAPCSEEVAERENGHAYHVELSKVLSRPQLYDPRPTHKSQVLPSLEVLLIQEVPGAPFIWIESREGQGAGGHAECRIFNRPLEFKRN